MSAALTTEATVAKGVDGTRIERAVDSIPPANITWCGGLRLPAARAEALSLIPGR
ncbi:hypothetical protein [Arthrobacter oryzae]|uniref:hypothetical protein n=1 Tax=Arthrobacter oryzae TaxID=409290 RepID=UPI00273AA603|nr:hypothetical protein [Arthrobacter oryzae]WLQ07620.1 hypothetical protein Q8Z05_05570 [Arthrobacter oryzae]